MDVCNNNEDKRVRNKIRTLFSHSVPRTLAASISCHMALAISLGEDICAETVLANGLVMDLDLSVAPLEAVWVADVTEVLFAEEAGEILKDLPFPPEI